MNQQYREPKKPLVTIGVPVFNGADTISDALDSLLAQTWVDFTLIISDNGSTDNTASICLEYQARDSRIRYNRQPSTLPPAMNFRFLLMMAETPYFMWAAADDLWAPGFIEKNLQNLEAHPDAILSQSKVLFSSHGIPSHYSQGTYTLEGSIKENLIRFFKNPSDNSRFYGLFRTDVLKRIFPHRNFHASDWAVSGASLKFGKHLEIAETLMIRETSSDESYEKAVLRDHRFFLFRMFPLLYMTGFLLFRIRLPISVELYYRLTRLNLYLHCLFGLYRSQKFSKQFLLGTLPIMNWLDQYFDRAPKVKNAQSQPHAKSLLWLRVIMKRWVKSIWRLAPLSITTRVLIKKWIFRHLHFLVGDLGTFRDLQPIRDVGKAIAPEANPSQGFLLPTSGWKPLPVMGHSKAAASIVVIVKDKLLSTLAMLDSLSKSIPSNTSVQIILVDDGSVDATSVALKNYPDLQIIQLKSPSGFAMAANSAIPHTHGDVVVFIDQESIVQPGFLCPLLSLLESHSDADMVGPKVITNSGYLLSAGDVLDVNIGPQGLGRLDRRTHHPDYAFVHDVDFLPTCFAIRRKCLIELGGFKSGYQTLDMAGAEIAVQVRKSGHHVLYQPSSVITSYSENITIVSDDMSRDWCLLCESERSYLGNLSNSCKLSTEPNHFFRSSRVLYIDAETPMPDKNAGSIEALNFMLMLYNMGFGVTFIPESNFVHHGTYTEALQQHGVEAIYYPPFSSVEQLAQSGYDFNLIFLCRSYIAQKYAEQVRKLWPKAKIVFYTVDLHFLREMREAELSGDAGATRSALASRAAELLAIQRCDATIVLSSFEYKLLKHELPNAKIHVIPLIRKVADHLNVPDFNLRRDIVFVGTFQHPPNRDAVIYFANEVWPLIHMAIPDARFLIVGSNVTPDIEALASDSIEVLGYVQYLEEVLSKCRLTVAPLRYGAGLKGKVSTSLEAGIPVVASPIAVEGMPIEIGEEILIGNSPQEFAEQVVRLYLDEKLWNRISKAGFEFIKREYSIGVNLKRIKSLLYDIELMNQDVIENELTLINEEINNSLAIYKPSKFWQSLARRNESQIKLDGINSFKRSSNNNYFQWLPGDYNNDQVQSLLRFWMARPSNIPIEVVGFSLSSQDWEGIEGFDGTRPFENPQYKSFYTFFVGMLWYYASCHDPIGAYQYLDEPSLGKPLPTYLGEKRISQDLANSIHEWSRIRTLMGGKPLSGKRIMELGAGYGRLAYVFLHTEPCQYVIVDISPALFISQWYLRQLFPEKRIFQFRHFKSFEEIVSDFTQAELCFITPNQLELLPDGYFDATVSISSLHEMTPEQINHYKNMIDDKTRSYVYFKQWKFWTNPLDGNSVNRSDFLMGDNWDITLDCDHEIQSQFCELGFRRRGVV